jgi:hypothetical protein
MEGTHFHHDGYRYRAAHRAVRLRRKRIPILIRILALAFTLGVFVIAWLSIDWFVHLLVAIRHKQRLEVPMILLTLLATLFGYLALMG